MLIVILRLPGHYCKRLDSTFKLWISAFGCLNNDFGSYVKDVLRDGKFWKWNFQSQNCLTMKIAPSGYSGIFIQRDYSVPSVKRPLNNHLNNSLNIFNRSPLGYRTPVSFFIYCSRTIHNLQILWNNREIDTAAPRPIPHRAPGLHPPRMRSRSQSRTCHCTGCRVAYCG